MNTTSNGRLLGLLAQAVALDVARRALAWAMRATQPTGPQRSHTFVVVVGNGVDPGEQIDAEIRRMRCEGV